MSIRNSKGFGTLEVLIAFGILASVAITIASFMTYVRINETRLASSSTGNNLAAMIGSLVVSRSGAAKVLNNGAMCGSATTPVTASATADEDPFCCTDATNPYCTAERRALLCGVYGNSPYQTQNIRTSATWARNLYVNCMSGTSAPCNITNNGGTICSGDGLVFDSTSELTTFFGLLPDTYTFTNLPAEQIPQAVRLKIQVFNSNDLDTPIACGTQPGSGWTVDIVMKVTVTVLMNDLSGSQTNSRNAVQSYSMLLTWPRDSSRPVTVSGATDIAQAGGPDDAVSATVGAGVNADNQFLNSAPSAYFQDGTVRAAAQCVAVRYGAGPSQQPGLTYLGWQKLLYQTMSSESGSSFSCHSGFTANPFDMNQCCDAINSGTVIDNTSAGDPGTVVRAAWNTPVAEGTVIAISLVDSQGNASNPKNFIFSPGYCPPTNTYCADGKSTGIEGSTITVAGTGASKCPATATWPAFTPNIFCRPHDGCFDFCPQGTRTGQNCPATTTTYCSAGVNFDSVTNRGCGAGIDCTVDVRCSNTVCDDCGDNTCSPSTIAVVAKPLGAPYSTLPAQFPTPYIGVAGANGCPATDTYCSVTAANPATIFGTGVQFLPKDNCGNSCPDGTRTSQNCPATNTYCSIGNTGPRCSGAQCTTPGDDCGTTCPASTIPAGESCPATNTYCPATAPNPATALGLVNTPQFLPADTCGADCPVGTRAPGNTCPAVVMNPATCSGAPPIPKDDCGWDCPAQDCLCPDATTVCAGVTILDASNVPCGTGTKIWTIADRAAWCPANAFEKTYCDDVYGHHSTAADSCGDNTMWCPAVGDPYPNCGLDLPLFGLKIGASQFVMRDVGLPTPNIGINTSLPTGQFEVRSSLDDIGDGGVKIVSNDFGVSGGYLVLNKNAGANSVGIIQAGDTGGPQSLSLNPNGGNVGIASMTPSEKLEVGGTASVTNIVTGSQTTTGQAIDWNNGNLISTNSDCPGNFSFANLRDGGTYNLFVTGTGTTQCNFETAVSGSDAGTVSYRWSPANNIRIANRITNYELKRIGNIVFVTWKRGWEDASVDGGLGCNTCNITLNWTSSCGNGSHNFTVQGDKIEFKGTGLGCSYSVTSNVNGQFKVHAVANGGSGGSSNGTAGAGGGGGACTPVGGFNLTWDSTKTYTLVTGYNIAGAGKATTITASGTGLVLSLGGGSAGTTGGAGGAGGVVLVGLGLSGGAGAAAGGTYVNGGNGANTAFCTGGGGGGGGSGDNSFCPANTGALGGSGGSGQSASGTSGLNGATGTGGGGCPVSTGGTGGGGMIGLTGNFGGGGGGGGGSANAGFGRGGPGAIILEFVRSN